MLPKEAITGSVGGAGGIQNEIIDKGRRWNEYPKSD
jgi:hypothetical protein